MPVLPLLLLATPLPPVPPCRVSQLKLTLDRRDGDFDGMSHSGTELSIRNSGLDCTIAALPTIQLRDARNRVLSVLRQPPRGMHPGPVMVPVRVAAGHRVAMEIRWVSGPVFEHSRSMRSAKVTVKVGSRTLAALLMATVYGEAGKPATFEQSPLRAVEGLAEG